MQTSSAWDDYFDALSAYLKDVDASLREGGLAVPPSRMASRPGGALPADQEPRWDALVRETHRLIAVAELRRHQVSTLLAPLRRSDRRGTAPRSHLVDYEL